MAAKKKAKKKITKRRVGRPAKKAPRGRVGRPAKAKKKTKVAKKRVGRPAGKKVGKKKRVGRPAKKKTAKVAKKRVGRPPGKVAKKRPGRPAKKKTKAAASAVKRPVGRPRKYPAATSPVRKKKRTIGRGRRSAGESAASAEDEKHLSSLGAGNDARGALADLGDDELFDDDK